MELGMKDTGKMTSNMVLALKYGLTMHDMKVSTKKVKSMEKEC